jgi:hypothetical protein
METGKIYFYTATVLKWNRILFENKLKSLIIESLGFLVQNEALKLFGFVIR